MTIGDDTTSQLRELREQLDLQSEAISKLVEVVSAIAGIDAAALSAYAMRTQRPRSTPASSPAEAEEAVDAPAPASDPSLTAAPLQAV